MSAARRDQCTRGHSTISKQRQVKDQDTLLPLRLDVCQRVSWAGLASLATPGGWGLVGPGAVSRGTL